MIPYSMKPKPPDGDMNGQRRAPSRRSVQRAVSISCQKFLEVRQKEGRRSPDFRPECVLMRLRSFLRSNHARVREIYNTMHTSDEQRRSKWENDGLENRLSKRDVRAGLQKLGIQLSPSELDDFFDILDTSGGGFVSFQDLFQAIASNRSASLSKDLHKSNQRISPHSKFSHGLKDSPPLQKIVKSMEISEARKLLSPPASESLDEEFKRELGKLEKAVKFLHDRVHDERSEWHNFWMAVARRSSILIQSRVRGWLARRRLGTAILCRWNLRLHSIAVAMAVLQKWKHHLNARTIQKYIRRHIHARRTLVYRRERTKAVIAIQSRGRIFLTQRCVRAKRRKQNMKRQRSALLKKQQDAAGKIQLQWRRNQSRRIGRRFRYVVQAARSIVIQRRSRRFVFGSNPSIKSELAAALEELKRENDVITGHKNSTDSNKIRKSVLAELGAEKKRSLPSNTIAYRSISVKNSEAPSNSPAGKSSSTPRQHNRGVVQNTKFKSRNHKINQKNRGFAPTKSMEENVVNTPNSLDTFIVLNKARQRSLRALAKPTVVSILDRKLIETLSGDPIVEFRVRWKKGKESWISKKVLLDESFFDSETKVMVSNFEGMLRRKEEEENLRLLHEAITLLQAEVRGFICRHEYYLMQTSALRIQSMYRARAGRLEGRRQQLLAARYKKRKIEMAKKRLSQSDVVPKDGEVTSILAEVQASLKKGILIDNSNAASKRMWRCTVCKFENERTDKTCALCRAEKPKSAMLALHRQKKRNERLAGGALKHTRGHINAGLDEFKKAKTKKGAHMWKKSSSKFAVLKKKKEKQESQS